MIITISGMFMAIAIRFWSTDLGFLTLSNFSTAIPHFLSLYHWIFFWNTWLTPLPADPFVPTLYSHQIYSTAELQALQLIVLAMFATLD